MRQVLTVAALAMAFAGGFAVRGVLPGEPVAHAQSSARVFELRTYTTNPGRLDALNARFRDHTLRLFEKHGMQNIGYWQPADGETAQNTLIYVLAHKSREAAKQSWSAFGKDPEWQKVAKASEADGRILAGAPQSIYLTPVDYSPMK
jgi:hypothetical protein